MTVRLGGHITGVTVAGMNTGVSLDFVRDSNCGKGVYGGLNFQINF
ncbi:cellulose biosynthesis protein BcsS [Bradyrhizobium macuxiense]|nr:cellulose biosynthesis protein BcsS [Bradyrhizobium macuxiense]